MSMGLGLGPEMAGLETLSAQKSHLLNSPTVCESQVATNFCVSSKNFSLIVVVSALEVA